MCLVELKLSSSHGAQKADHVTYMHSVDPLEKNQIQHQIEGSFSDEKIFTYIVPLAVSFPPNLFSYSLESPCNFELSISLHPPTSDPLSFCLSIYMYIRYRIEPDATTIFQLFRQFIHGRKT